MTGLVPRHDRRTDERILEDTCERMTAHGYLNAREIEVTVRGGGVTSTEKVPDRRAKRLAEELADSVSGVRDVHNRLNPPSQRLITALPERPPSIRG